MDSSNDAGEEKTAIEEVRNGEPSVPVVNGIHGVLPGPVIHHHGMLTGHPLHHHPHPRSPLPGMIMPGGQFFMTPNGLVFAQPPHIHHTHDTHLHHHNTADGAPVYLNGK